MTTIRPTPPGDGDLEGLSSSNSQQDVFGRVTAIIAQFAVVAVGLDYYVAKGLNISLIVAVLSLPLWVTVLRRYPPASWIVGLTVVALLWGGGLSFRLSTTHSIDYSNAMVFSGAVLAGAAAFVLILWARQFVSLARVALLYGIGRLTYAMIFTARDYKFDLALPVTFIVLGIVEQRRNRFVPAVAVIVLGVFGVLDEARSYFAFCVIAAILTIWQVVVRPNTEERASVSRIRRWYPSFLLAAVGLVMYFTLTSLLAGGAFGTVLQARSTAQIDASGSLIAGGRPEWAATRELMKMNPAGYGLGAVPNWTDLEAGKSGLASINIDAGGYANNYMFGGAFELHSILSDLWVNCGLMGIALVALIMFTFIKNLSHRLSMRRASTIVLFSSLLAMWSLLFGPVYTDLLPAMVALGLSMLPKDSNSAAAPLDRRR